MSLDVLITLLSQLSGTPLTAAVLTVVTAVAVAIVLRALAVVLREVPGIIEARRRPRGARTPDRAVRTVQLTLPRSRP